VAQVNALWIVQAAGNSMGACRERGGAPSSAPNGEMEKRMWDLCAATSRRCKWLPRRLTRAWVCGHRPLPAHSSTEGRLQPGKQR